MKRTFYFLVGALLALPAMARDFTYEYQGQSLTYTVIDEDAKTCSTKCGADWTPANNISGELTIPSVAKDGDTEYTVTKIGEQSFYYNEQLTKVRIPDSVTEIDGYAFSACIHLNEVDFGNSVTTINVGAFYQCFELRSVILPNTATSLGMGAFSRCYALTNVKLPDTIDQISNQLFAECTELQSIEIPNSVRKIEYSAFYACQSLQSVNLNDEITSIGNGAFLCCFNLRDITLPAGLIDLGDGAFGVCINLRSINISDSNKYFKSLDGVLYTKNVDRVVCVPGAIESIDIPASVTEIGAFAFKGCTGLKNVDIPDNVTLIDRYAFHNCTNLRSVSIGRYVTTIGEYAFAYCSINSVFIGPAVTNVGENAFADDRYITKAAYPATIDNPFSGDIVCLVKYGNADTLFENGIIYSADKSKILFADTAFKGSLTVPETVNEICDYSFAFCSNLTGIKIPGSVTRIGTSTFAYCSSLSSVNLPDGLTSIGDRAFFACPELKTIGLPNTLQSIGYEAFYTSGLKSIVLPDALQSIGEEAFAGTNLTSVSIPASVDNIGDGAFAYTQLRSFSVDADNKSYTANDGILYTKDVTTLVAVPCIRLCVEIPETVTRLYDWSFMGCYNLETLILNDALSSFSESIFRCCYRLAEIYYPSANPVEGSEYIFDQSVYSSARLYVPEGAESVFRTMQPWCNFDIIEMDASVETVGDDADAAFDMDATFDLYNLQGAVVRRGCTSADLNAVTPGIYIICQGAYTRKIAIN